MWYSLKDCAFGQFSCDSQGKKSYHRSIRIHCSNHCKKVTQSFVEASVCFTEIACLRLVKIPAKIYLKFNKAYISKSHE